MAEALDKPVYQSGETLRVERDGSTSCRSTFKVRSDLLLQHLPRRRVTSHPVYRQLIAEDIEAVIEPGGVARVTVTYYGYTYAKVTPGATGGDGGDGGDSITKDDPEVQFSETTTLVEMPIECHPDFPSWAGSGKNSPDYPGAKWDADGRFIEFGVGAPADLRGVKSYLVPQTEVVRSWSTTAKQTMSGLPKKIRYEGQDAIVMAFSSTLKGGVWVNEQRILVGANFSSRIYGSS